MGGSVLSPVIVWTDTNQRGYITYLNTPKNTSKNYPPPIDPHKRGDMYHPWVVFRRLHHTVESNHPIHLFLQVHYHHNLCSMFRRKQTSLSSCPIKCISRASSRRQPLRSFGPSTNEQATDKSRRGWEHTWHSTRSESSLHETVLVRRTSYRRWGPRL